MKAMPTSLRLKNSRLIVLIWIVLAQSIVTGCGTLNNGGGWGQDALNPIELKKIPHAAWKALIDPYTFIPAAGALVFGLSKWDKKVSHWAVEHTPIFGSTHNASDDRWFFEVTLYTEAFITALATPSGNDSNDWIGSKIKGMVVEGAAEALTLGMTSLLQNTTDRKRPNGSSEDSFPSAEAATSFSAVTLSNRNLDSIKMPKEIRTSIKIANVLLGTTVAWARVEAGAHYPSDVLAGAALGNFLSAVVHDSFMNLPKEKSYSFSIFPLRRGAMAQMSFVLGSRSIHQSGFIYRGLLKNDGKVVGGGAKSF